MGTLSSQFCCESKVSLKRKSIFKICARHLMSLRAEIMFQTEKKNLVLVNGIFFKNKCNVEAQMNLIKEHERQLMLKLWRLSYINVCKN